MQRLVDRENIEKALKQINDSENRLQGTSVDEIIAGIDAINAVDVEGWHNGVHSSDREAERQLERIVFEKVTDWHRDFELVIIDSPFVAFSWKATGTVEGEAFEISGSSFMEFNDDGKIQRYWTYADSTQLSSLMISPE